MRKTIVSITLALAALGVAAPAGAYTLRAVPTATLDPSIVHVDSVTEPAGPTLDCLAPGPFASKGEYKGAVIDGGGVPPRTVFC